MLGSSMVVDQNMVCGSNTNQRDHFPRISCIPLFRDTSDLHPLLIHPRKVIHNSLYTYRAC